MTLASSPGPFPCSFSMFQRATLKSWEWAWGRGYHDTTLLLYTMCYEVIPNSSFTQTYCPPMHTHMYTLLPHMQTYPHARNN